MDAQTINNYLKRWGTSLYNEPIMRLVWSNDARELRTGTFAEYCGPLFIREVTDTREVQKYSWLDNRWVLERWFPPQLVINPELPHSNRGSYEPIYVFPENLPLSLCVVELICSAMFNAPPTKQEIHDQLDRQLADADRRETHDIEEGIGDAMRDPIASHLTTGSAVSLYFKGDENGTR